MRIAELKIGPHVHRDVSLYSHVQAYRRHSYSVIVVTPRYQTIFLNLSVALSLSVFLLPKSYFRVCSISRNVLASINHLL